MFINEVEWNQGPAVRYHLLRGPGLAFGTRGQRPLSPRVTFDKMSYTAVMTNSEIQRVRLYNQRLAGMRLKKPEAVVQLLVAVQAQDYAAAKWAIAQRTVDVTDAGIDRALAAGTILRTHVLRPTWHFVAPADIRWMLKLTAPRVNALNAYYYRKTGLDEAVFKKSNAALTSALRGGGQLTRVELASLHQKARIIKSTDDPLRLMYIIMRAELDMVICSGARRGKQFTYALLEERVPGTAGLNRTEALAKLVRRFFTSRGPATVKEFTRWSSLSAADARAGLVMVEGQLTRVVVDGETYWSGPDMPSMQEPPPRAHLLPAYDEYLLSYKTHGDAMLDLTPEHRQQVSAGAGQTILLDGKVVGTWKRSNKKDSVDITPCYFVKLTAAQIRAIAAAAGRYGKFVELPASLQNL